MSKPVCLIKCLECHELFQSPTQFRYANVFFTSSVVGSVATCLKCRATTRCNKENMYFNPGDGTIHTGDDTIPEG